MDEALKVFNDDAEKLYKKVLGDAERNLNEALYPGDKRRIFIEALALGLSSVFAEANTQSQQNHLRYAEGEFLDLIGDDHNCNRILGSYATTLLKFSLKEPLSYNVLIPKGTRCAVNDYYFAVDSTVFIPAGEMSIGVGATATVKGTGANGFISGAIKTIVDTIAGVDSVINIKPTDGGDDDESDDAYRERIRMSGGQFAAGTRAQYTALAKSANTSISDIEIDDSAERGTVKIIVLCAGGEIPSEGILENVLKACNDPEKRPQNDLVSVEAPAAEPYDIELEIHTTIENKADALTWIEGKGKDAGYEDGCIGSFMKWQAAKLGRDINPSALAGYCMDGKGSDGNRLVKRVNVIKPEFKSLSIRQIARWSGSISITYTEEDE